MLRWTGSIPELSDSSRGHLLEGSQCPSGMLGSGSPRPCDTLGGSFGLAGPAADISFLLLSLGKLPLFDCLSETRLLSLLSRTRTCCTPFRRSLVRGDLCACLCPCSLAIRLERLAGCILRRSPSLKHLSL